MPNVYILGPWPLPAAVNLANLAQSPILAQHKIHWSVSPDGTQCLVQGDFPMVFLASLPNGYSVKTHTQAKVTRAAWDSLVDTGEH